MLVNKSICEMTLEVIVLLNIPVLLKRVYVDVNVLQLLSLVGNHSRAVYNEVVKSPSCAHVWLFRGKYYVPPSFFLSYAA